MDHGGSLKFCDMGKETIRASNIEVELWKLPKNFWKKLIDPNHRASQYLNIEGQAKQLILEGKIK